MVISFKASSNWTSRRGSHANLHDFPVLCKVHENLRSRDFRLIAGDYMKHLALVVCTFFMIYTNPCLAQDRPGTGKNDRNTAPSISPEAQMQEENWTDRNAEKSGLDKSFIRATVLGKSDLPGYSNELVRV